jgi:hypothetical protein
LVKREGDYISKHYLNFSIIHFHTPFLRCLNREHLNFEKTSASLEYPPVAVITNEQMAAFRKEEATKPADPNAVASPFGDESVLGYPTDEAPK